MKFSFEQDWEEAKKNRKRKQRKGMEMLDKNELNINNIVGFSWI